MARQLRLAFPGAILHVTCRGNERRAIVRDDRDRKRFFDLLAEAVDRFHWFLYQYVLMTNHFHFVLELTEESFSSGMKWLNGRYGQLFNKRHHRAGHLFQGRPDARLVQKETYLLDVLRYDVLNPVRAGMVARPEEYRWSSHQAIAGLCETPSWLAADRTLSCFAPDPEVARPLYRGFVDDGLRLNGSPWDNLVGQIYLGSESWVEEMRAKVESGPRSDDHPAAQKLPRTWTMAAVIAAVGRALGVREGVVRFGRGGDARSIAAWVACREGGLDLRSIAAALRLRSFGRISDMIRSCDERVSVDHEWRARVERCVDFLQALEKTKNEGATPN